MVECSSNEVYDHFIDELYMRSFFSDSLADKHEAKTKFNCQMNSDEDGLKFADKFIESTIDAHDGVLTKEELALFKDQVDGRARGIGIKLQTALDNSNRKLENGPFIIEHVIPGSEADKAGLKRGDKVLRVDSIDTSNEVVNSFTLFRHITTGPDENVELLVERNGEILEFEVAKTEKERSAVWEHLDEKIAYIKIDSFLNKNLSIDLNDLLEQFTDADAFMIDLRDNSGGLLLQGIEAASLFVDSGTISTSKQRVRSDPENPIYDHNFLKTSCT